MKALLLTEHRSMALPLPSQPWPRRAIGPRAVGDDAVAPPRDGFALVSTARGSTSHEHSEPNGRPQPPQTGFATGTRLTQSECDIIAICKLQSALLNMYQRCVTNGERN